MVVKVGFTLREERRLRRIFGRKIMEVTKHSRKLYKEEFHVCYHSPNIIRVIRTKRMRQMELVVYVKEIKN
jgi:hypothetical protein